MKKGTVDILLPSVLGGLALVALGLWLTLGRSTTFEPRLPGQDGVPDDGPAVELPPPEPTGAVQFDGQPSAITSSWPWFRGVNFDAIGSDEVSLARQWPADGPPVLWEIELGPGHAGAAVEAGRVFVLDYDLDALADTMRCFSLDDGAEIWRNSYPIELDENHGMSRTVPAVSGAYVVSFGPMCHVACWSVETGDCLWLIDLVQQYGAKVPSWYAGQCPIIDGDRVILAPCGTACLIAVDLTTGETVWESEQMGKWEMTHVSILPMTFAEKKMYVYCGSHGVVGVSADDGSTLWQTTAFQGKMATCPTPVDIGDGRIFFSSGYGSKANMMMRLNEINGDLAIKSLFELTPKQFESEQHTPLYYQNHLYGVRTQTGGDQVVCMDLDGKEIWNSGRDKFGRGPYMIADGLLILLDDEGLLTIADATAVGYQRLAQAEVIEHGHDAWAPMALVDGRLILRDRTRMKCLNLAAAP
jgi:outer membrane protein assembly factor BamB